MPLPAKWQGGLSIAFLWQELGTAGRSPARAAAVPKPSAKPLTWLWVPLCRAVHARSQSGGQPQVWGRRKSPRPSLCSAFAGGWGSAGLSHTSPSPRHSPGIGAGGRWVCSWGRGRARRLALFLVPLSFPCPGLQVQQQCTTAPSLASTSLLFAASSCRLTGDRALLGAGLPWGTASGCQTGTALSQLRGRLLCTSQIPAAQEERFP